MGLFERLKRVFRASANSFLSKAEKPEKMLNQVILDMNEQLIEAKKSVASAIADEKKLERQMQQQLDLANEWDRKARLAVKAGKEDLAKEALIRKQEYLNYGQEYKKQWEAQHSSVEKLKQSLRQLQQKIEEAQRKKNLLIARSRRVEAQNKINRTIGSMADTSAFQAFDKMSEKVDELEARSEAMAELSENTSYEEDLEKQFLELESSATSPDLLLEDLKQKMLEEEKPE